MRANATGTWRRIGASLVAGLCLVVAASGQTGSDVPTADATIALEDIVVKADAADRELAAITAAVADDPLLMAFAERLPGTVQEIDHAQATSAEVLATNPSFDEVREVEARWTRLGIELAAWQRETTARASVLTDDLARLENLDATWTRTIEAARQAGVPTEVVSRAELTVSRIREGRIRAEEARGNALTLQSRIIDQESRVRDALVSARLARTTTVGRLLSRDSDAVWYVLPRTRAGDLASMTRRALGAEIATVEAYARQHSDRFGLHFGLIVLAALGAAWMRHRARPWVAKDLSLAPAAAVFEYPLAIALVVTALAVRWIYPDAPRALGSLVGVLALVSTAVVLWSLVEHSIRPLLVALVALYIADVAATLARTVPLSSRFVLLVQSGAALLFLAWFARRTHAATWVRRGAAVASAGFATAMVASLLGFVTLSQFVVAGCLGSAYAAVVLFAASRIFDGLAKFALRGPPFDLLQMVRGHRPTLRRRASRVVQVVLGFLWLGFTLELFAVREPVRDAAASVLAASASIGQYRVSLGDVLLFVGCIVAAVLVKRFLLFVLEEDVYPRANLPRGVPYAVSTIARYAVLVVGFVFALGAMGVDLTRFTILAGAFGIGLGLGLQNVVANFASGLVLLFERPVKVGDTIEVDSHEGDLKRIGLRSSVLRTREGSEVIVPNTDLISEKVVNWTLSDQQRRLTIDVGVEYGTEPERVIELLTKVARSHSAVLPSPAPQTLFLGFGESALNFQLRAWTGNDGKWQVVRSDLAIGMNAALRDAGISIPYPQRDVRVVSVERGALDGLAMAARTDDRR